MGNSDVLITCEEVSKRFCRDFKKSLYYGIRDCAVDVLGGNRASDVSLRPEEFWATHDINFEVTRGECLGLIGRNGAGKTTLLKMLNGLIKPDHGQIRMRGQTGAMIALGAGFNPILTGRENVYVNGSILGLSRPQIADRLDEIVEFAEIPEAIDAPVRNYSSGMQVRLGFAVACMLMKPDVLLLDEVLAVGDLGFRRKCYAKIHDLLSDAAVVFTSHSMDHIAYICTNTLLLQNGVGQSHSVPAGIEAYLDLQRQEVVTSTEVKLNDPVVDIRFPVSNFETTTGESIDFVVEIESILPIDDALLTVPIFNETDTVTAAWHSTQHSERHDIPAGKSSIRIPLGPLHLSKGEYHLGFNLLLPNSVKFAVASQRAAELKLNSEFRRIENGSAILPFHGCDIQTLRP